MVSCFNRSSEAIKCTLMTTSLMKLLKSTLPKIRKVKFISPMYLRTGKNVLTNVDTIKACFDSMVESLQDGVSEESVADTLKDFQINGKKISKKF